MWGGKSLQWAMGWRGRQKANLYSEWKSGRSPAPLLQPQGPSMGPGEEQEEVNRSVARKLAPFTPIIDAVMPCFMLLSWRQPGRASARDDKWWCRMDKPKGWRGQETKMHRERYPPPQGGLLPARPTAGGTGSKRPASNNETPSGQPEARRQAIRGGCNVASTKHLPCSLIMRWERPWGGEGGRKGWGGEGKGKKKEDKVKIRNAMQSSLSWQEEGVAGLHTHSGAHTEAQKPGSTGVALRCRTAFCWLDCPGPPHESLPLTTLLHAMLRFEINLLKIRSLGKETQEVRPSTSPSLF